MGNFEETLQNIDGFCKVIVKKMPENMAELENKIVVEQIENPLPKESIANEPLETGSSNSQFIPLSQVEEPLIDVFEEEDFLRILVQCHCREQQVKFYVHADGIRICREKCHAEADGTVVCVDTCQKLNLRTDRLQLENRLFVVAQCNNNEVLEAMIPKKKKQ
jgi:hypothetical protein